MSTEQLFPMRYRVGGAVRDQMLGRKSKDVDFTCVLDDAHVRRLTADEAFDALGDELEREGYKIFARTPQYFTYRARSPEGEFHDYVLARIEGPYSDGRRPDWVRPGTIDDDLARRDFTINAMARDPLGLLYDPFEGVRDLDLHTIRCVGDPVDRFTEDPLRVLRALRFAVTLGFIIEPETHRAIEAMPVDAIAGVSKERRRDELEKMFKADIFETLDWLTHRVSPDIRDAILYEVMLRPCFTFRGEP